MNDHVIPPCAGKWALFDSTELADHQRAAVLCQTCPMLDACQERSTETVAAWGLTHQYGPRGTWAGKLMAPKKPNGGRKTEEPICGTTKGAWAHRRKKEPKCAECREAERIYKAEQRRNRGAAA